MKRLLLISMLVVGQVMNASKPEDVDWNLFLTGQPGEYQKMHSKKLPDLNEFTEDDLILWAASNKNATYAVPLYQGRQFIGYDFPVLLKHAMIEKRTKLLDALLKKDRDIMYSVNIAGQPIGMLLSVDTYPVFKKYNFNFDHTYDMGDWVRELVPNKSNPEAGYRKLLDFINSKNEVVFQLKADLEDQEDEFFDAIDFQ